MAKHNFFHYLLTALWITIKAIPLIGVGVVVFLVGFLIFKNAGQPYDIMIGFPLMLLGASATGVNLYEALASILDLRYSRGHCPICNPPNSGV